MIWPKRVLVEVEGPWLWGLFTPGHSAWSRLSLGFVHVSFLWKEA